PARTRSPSCTLTWTPRGSVDLLATLNARCVRAGNPARLIWTDEHSSLSLLGLQRRPATISCLVSPFALEVLRVETEKSVHRPRSLWQSRTHWHSMLLSTERHRIDVGSRFRMISTQIPRVAQSCT